MIRRRSKFGAKRAASLTTGHSYASTAERDRAEELHLLVRSGHVTDLVEQPRVYLTAGIHWRLDFAYRDGGLLVHEDVKGFETPEFKLKCKLWAQFGPSPLRIVKRQGRGRAFVVTAAILPEAATMDGRGMGATEAP